VPEFIVLLVRVVAARIETGCLGSGKETASMF
jgi:hypothetical protein